MLIRSPDVQTVGNTSQWLHGLGGLQSFPERFLNIFNGFQSFGSIIILSPAGTLKTPYDMGRYFANWINTACPTYST